MILIALRTAEKGNTGVRVKQQFSGKKSNARWWVLFLLCLMYLICFADRVIISVVAPLVSKEFGFSKVTMGYIFSAFVSAYALGQIPGGWLGDRFGPRKVLSSIVSFWSVMTITTGLAFSFGSFVVIRFIFGFSEGGAYPTATRAMQLWYTKAERGLVQGLTHGASRIGGAIVAPIAVAIISIWGWRAVFNVFGVVGILWAILFYVVYRDKPEDNKWVNQAELAHIRGIDADGNIKTSSGTKEKPKVEWKRLLSTPNLWFVVAPWVCWNYAIYFFLTWLPVYLIEYRHFSLKSMAIFASLPLFAGALGDAVGGLATDAVFKITGKLKFARQAVAVPSLLFAAALMIPAASTRSPYVAVGCLVAAQFFLECVQGPQWSLPMDVGGEFSGTVAGIMNGCGNMAGALSPIVFGFLVQRGMWQAPFFVTAIILMIGAAVWIFLIDPNKQVTETRTLKAASVAS